MTYPSRLTFVLVLIEQWGIVTFSVPGHGDY